MTRTKKPEPIAVLISDIHFTIATLEEASQSLLKAQFKAVSLDVPLVLMGDTLDAKAMIRAECANKIIEMLSVHDAPPTIVLVGNHDKINEKSVEHSLNFMKPFCTVVDTIKSGDLMGTDVTIIPYQHDIQVIKNLLDDHEHPPSRILLMHQGIQGSSAGHYIQDKTAIPQDWIKNHRVISGHYHARQDIDCYPEAKLGYFPYQGIASYVGNPYSLGFGEANDGPKGYQVLYSDGSLEFINTNLRRHRVISFNLNDMAATIPGFTDTDILWVKITGESDKLAQLSKEKVADLIGIKQDFRLDLIPTDTKSIAKTDNNAPQTEILDSVINNLQNTDEDRKTRLKELWRKFT